MTRHILLTNDFPPKIGGIQSYLWELWRRLDPDSFVVVTTPHADAQTWDSQQPFPIERMRERWLLPTRSLAQRVQSIASRYGATFVVIDPAVPLGAIGKKLDMPYALVLHGAEYTIPARLPILKARVDSILRNSIGVIAAGDFVANAVRRVHGTAAFPVISIPPGVDCMRFQPLSFSDRCQARAEFGLPFDGPVVVGVSRLVPRKGFDRLVQAAAQLRSSHPSLAVVLAGSGRERKHLDRLIASTNAPVTMLGRVPDADLPRLLACADVFCMPCHDRWMGLEVEGFGIVFLEAGASGVPSVAGLSGGSADAVLHGTTGLTVPSPVSPEAICAAIDSLLTNQQLRESLGKGARALACSRFDYNGLAKDLERFLTGL